MLKAFWTQTSKKVSSDTAFVTPKQRQSWSDFWFRVLKLQATEVRIGRVIVHNGRLLQVTKAEHTQGHGRQLGNVQLELKDLKKHTKHTERRRPYDLVEVAHVDSRRMQVLFVEGNAVSLMDPSTYEQVEVSRDLFGELARFLFDSMDVTLNFVGEQPVTAELPMKIAIEVTHAELHARGDTVGASLKQATLANGLEVRVPPYVQIGQVVEVDTRDGTFVRRLQ